MELEREVGRDEFAPSLDRVDPRLGYVKGNVRVISWRANRMKNNATPDEVELLARYVRESLGRWR